MPAIKKLISHRDAAPLLARQELYRRSNESLIHILITVVGVLLAALVVVGVLIFLRRSRRRRAMDAESTLPQHADTRRSSNHRRLTIHTGGRQSVLVFDKDEKPMLSNPRSPPHSPDNVPEIHITFPDEQDDHGRRMSGRVVVVRVGETSVGLEPVRDEQLPAYEKESSGGFQSIDIDQIGGLKEKDRSQFP